MSHIIPILIIMDTMVDIITGMLTGIIPIHQVVTIGLPHILGIIDKGQTSKYFCKRTILGVSYIHRSGRNLVS